MGLLGELRVLVRPTVTGVALGCIMYLAADTASDIYTFCVVRRKALERVRNSTEVAGLVGEPYKACPWYDGTLFFSHRDHVAHVSFQLIGSARTTDVVARASRQPGMRLNMLYNALGTGEWDLVTCQAMFPGEGGLAQPRNLMDPLPVVAAKSKQEAAAQAAAAAAHAQPGGVAAPKCLPCKQQQQQQLRNQRSSQWSWLWWWWGSGGAGSTGNSSSSGGGAPAGGDGADAAKT